MPAASGSPSSCLVELFLADIFARSIVERIFAHPADLFAPVVENALERPLACTISDEALGVAQLRVAGIHPDPAQFRGTVNGQWRSR